MQGIILNEDGYVTCLPVIFNCIEDEVRSLNWRISNIECYGRDTYRFPFEECDDGFMDGSELFELIQAHPDTQFVWGVFSGIPKNIDYQEIKKNPVIDVRSEATYMDRVISHIDPNAILEIVAFDSTETHVLADSNETIIKLKQRFKKAKSLEKYICD